MFHSFFLKIPLLEGALHENQGKVWIGRLLQTGKARNTQEDLYRAAQVPRLADDQVYADSRSGRIARARPPEDCSHRPVRPRHKVEQVPQLRGAVLDGSSRRRFDFGD